MGHHYTAQRWNLSWLIPVVLVTSLFATFSWAGNVVKISSLLSNPESYQSRIVRVTGVVIDDPQVKRLKRWTDNVNKCVQFFTVQDETGSILAAYEVSCSGAMDLLRIRDSVTLEARLERKAGGAGQLNVLEVVSKMAKS